MGKRGPKGKAPGNLYATACDWFWRLNSLRVGTPDSIAHDPEIRMLDDNNSTFAWKFTPFKGKPTEPDTLRSLLRATTVEEVRAACERSPWWLNPRFGGGPGSPYPGLPALAQAFLDAKGHRRYPRSDRPTSEESRIWFLAIALAAKTWEIGLGRAINLLQKSPSFQKPQEPKVMGEFRERTGGIIELVDEKGSYYTDGRKYWRVPKHIAKK